MKFSFLVLILTICNTSISQIDRVFVQCPGDVGDPGTHNYSLTGPELNLYLNYLKSNPVQSEYSCPCRIWFISNGICMEWYRSCGLDEMQLNNFKDSLHNISIRTFREEGLSRALNVKDSLEAINSDFMVQPSTEAKQIYELNFHAYFTTPFDSTGMSPKVADSIFYHDYILKIDNALRNDYSYIDSVNFHAIFLGYDRIMFGIYLEESKFDFEPIKNFGLYFKKEPIVEPRTYTFTMFYPE